jgi:hypothetical protein
MPFQELFHGSCHPTLGASAPSGCKFRG